MLHNLGLYSLSLMVFAAVLVMELLIAAKIDKRNRRAGINHDI